MQEIQFINPFLRCAALVVVSAFGAIQVPGLASAAGEMLDTRGFDAGYSLAPLAGQQNDVGQSPWQTHNIGEGPSSAAVQNSVALSGPNAVQVDRAADSFDRWAVPLSGVPANRYVLIDWDMNVTATGAGAEVLGPFFGVEAYDFTTSAKVLGTLGVDATTGSIIYQREDSGSLDETGDTVTLGQWHHFQIRLDFLSDQYEVFLDGVSLLSELFVDGASEILTDADISALAAGEDPDSLAQTGTAYFDNFLIRDVVPGDFDFDGDVDGTDLASWEAAFGLNASADADGDDDADGGDFLIWQQNFQPPSSAANPASTGVPEPSSMLLTITAIAAAAWRRRRCGAD